MIAMMTYIVRILMQLRVDRDLSLGSSDQIRAIKTTEEYDSSDDLHS